MTIVNCAVSHDRVVLAVDSGRAHQAGGGLRRDDTVSGHRVTKIALLSAAGLAVAGRGHLVFLMTVQCALQTAGVGWDDGVEAFAEVLEQASEQFCAQAPALGIGEQYEIGGVRRSIREQQVVIAGWSEKRERFAAMVYERPTAESAFVGREIEPGSFMVAPWDDANLGKPPCGTSDRAMLETASMQAALMQRRTPETPAGDVLVVAELRRDDYRVRRYPLLPRA